MRTLTAGATAWKAGPYYACDILVESSALNFHWSYDTLTAGSLTWEHRLWSISEIEYAIPPGGGVAVVNSLIIEVIENYTGQSLWALWDVHERLEGADITLALLPVGEAYDDRIKLFTGHIEKAEWANGIGRVTAVDDTLHGDILLPSTLVTPDVFPNAPAQSINRALPIVYGQGLVGRLPLAPLVMVDETTLVTYRAASHPLASLESGIVYGAWPADTRRLRTGDGATSDAATAELVLDEAITAKIFGGVGTTGSFSISRETDVDNASNAIDGNIATLAVLHTDSTLHSTGDGVGELGIKSTFEAPEGTNLLLIELRQHRRAVGSASTVTGTMFARLVNGSNVVVQDNIFVSESFRHTSNARNSAFFVRPVSLDATLGVEVLLRALHEGGLGTPGDTYEVGTISFILGYQPSSPLEQLYLDGSADSLPLFTGREDTAGTITGTAGAVIENPADVIRATLALDMGNTPEPGSFAATRTTFGASVFDGGLGAGWSADRLAAREVLQQMLLQATCYLFPAGDGTFKILKYSLNAVPQFDFTPTHIQASFEEGGRPVSSLRIEMSRLEMVHNTVTIHYNYHPAKQKYDSVVYASPSTSNHSDSAQAGLLVGLCGDSLTRYGTLPPREVFANWITTPALAEALLVHLVEYHWSQHIFVIFDTLFVGLHLEVGDFITLTHPDLPPLETGQPFEVIGLRYRFPRGQVPAITVTATRVLNKSIDGFRLRDDDGTIWRLAVDRAGALGFFPDTEDKPYPGRIFRILNPSTLYDYLAVQDQFDQTRYISLVTTGGLTEFLINTTPPAGTGYLVPLLLLGQDSQQYVIGAETFPDDTPELVITPVGALTYVQGFDLHEFGGTLWTFFVDRAGALQIFPASEPFPLAGLQFTRVGPDPAPNYLTLLDELGDTQYLRIVTQGGDGVFDLSFSPPSGTGYAPGSLYLRGATLHVYRLTAQSQQAMQVEDIS